jgi:hypothetical protein
MARYLARAPADFNKRTTRRHAASNKTPAVMNRIVYDGGKQLYI